MEITSFDIEGPRLITPVRHKDDRGWFMETFREETLKTASGKPVCFVQDNHSLSVQSGTLRGLHYQAPPRAQAKLVRCVAGRILDVCVDVRRSSLTYGRSLAVELSAENARQLFVPVGFLHGFLTLSPNTEVTYKVSDTYSREHDGVVRWNSAGVDWGLGESWPKLSDKDCKAPVFADWVSPFD